MNWILIFPLKLKGLELFTGINRRYYVMIATTKIRTSASHYVAWKYGYSSYRKDHHAQLECTGYWCPLLERISISSTTRAMAELVLPCCNQYGWIHISSISHAVVVEHIMPNITPRKKNIFPNQRQ